jgi:hypothetical protein
MTLTAYVLNNPRGIVLGLSVVRSVAHWAIADALSAIEAYQRTGNPDILCNVVQLSVVKAHNVKEHRDIQPCDYMTGEAFAAFARWVDVVRAAESVEILTGEVEMSASALDKARRALTSAESFIMRAGEGRYPVLQIDLVWPPEARDTSGGPIMLPELRRVYDAAVKRHNLTRAALTKAERGAALAAGRTRAPGSPIGLTGDRLHDLVIVVGALTSARIHAARVHGLASRPALAPAPAYDHDEITLGPLPDMGGPLSDGDLSPL